MLRRCCAARNAAASPTPAKAGSRSSPKTQMATSHRRSRRTARPVPTVNSSRWITRPATPERSGCRSRELTDEAALQTAANGLARLRCSFHRVRIVRGVVAGFFLLVSLSGLALASLAEVLAHTHVTSATTAAARRLGHRSTSRASLHDPESVVAKSLAWASVRECPLDSRGNPTAGAAEPQEEAHRNGASLVPRVETGARCSGAQGGVYCRLMKQKQNSSMPPEPSPGARKCSLSTMWLWPPAKGL